MKKPFIVSLLLGIVFLLGGCQFFHNTTSRFNAYFLSKETLKEVETSLFGNPQNNYYEVLDALVSIDTNDTRSEKANLDYVIEKASLPIQFHKTSKWVDDCYNLIGKARLYQGDFTHAITTFKYVNAQSSDDNARHTALIWLMRTFLETKEFNNFEFIKKVVNAETAPFNRENTRDYHLVMTQYQIHRDDYLTASEHLELAIPMLRGRAKKSRLNFIMGQLCRRTDQQEKAYKHFQIARKLSPEFELEFYADMNAHAVKPLNGADDFKELDRYYRKQAIDRNHWDYRDKIYYDWAEMELKRQDTPQAITYLNESVQLSTNNNTQKGYSYVRLGQIHYEVQRFEESAAYYDSAIQVLPKDIRDYEQIAERAAILQEFVEQLTIVRYEDKMIRLASLSPEEAMAEFEKEIEEEKENIIQKEENKKLNEQRRQQQPETTTQLASALDDDNAWYFYNSRLTVTGRSNFLRAWGSRPLEDNWRRSKKEVLASGRSKNNGRNATKLGQQEETEAGIEDVFSDVKSAEDRMSEIPDTPEKMAASLERLENALFELGKIYHYKLEEPNNTLKTFERVLNEFPESEFAPEAAYILYLLCRDFHKCDEETYRKLLVETYPESFYAKIILDPDYVQKMNAINKEVARKYAQAFDLYKNGMYTDAKRSLENITQSYPEHAHQDKVALLSAMLKAPTVGKLAYQNSLKAFLQDFPESELLPLAQKLLDEKSSGEELPLPVEEEQ